MGPDGTNGQYIKYVLGTFDQYHSKSILGYPVVLRLFRKYDFHGASSTLMILFQPNVL